MKKRFELRRRAGVIMEVLTNHQDQTAPFLVWDLNSQGVFLMSSEPPSIGEDLVCQFAFSSTTKQSFCFLGQVCRVSRGRRHADRGLRGFAVKFSHTTGLERLQVRNALRGTPPPVPSTERNNALSQAMGWA